MSADFRPPNPGLAAAGLALAVFMQILDTTIANVSLPTIAGNLNASAQQGTWVVTAFAVSNAIALPLTGWLSQRFGEVRLFIAATVLFTLTSFLCGTAHSMGTLIVFRALQGFAAGPLYPVAQSLMISIFPPQKRTLALAVLVTVLVVAPILGPILGGWITDSYSWPWIFLINVPVGIFASYAVWNQMRKKPQQTRRVPIDYVGLATLAIGIGSLQILLDTGNDEDWFASTRIVALAIVAAISIAVFLIWELTERHPVVDLRLFRHRNFTIGTLVYALSYGAFMGGLLLVPLWLQVQLHYTSLWAGLAMAPMGVFPILLMPLVGKYSHRFDMRALVTCAILVIASVFLLRSTFTAEVDFAYVASLSLFQGIGVPLLFTPAMAIVLSDLRQDEIASGSGLAFFIRGMAASFSVSITTYIWSHRAIVHHARMAEQFTPYSPSTHAATGIFGQSNTHSALAHLDAMIDLQAYQISFNEVFYLYGLLLFAMILLVWAAKSSSGQSMANSASTEH